MIDLIVRFNDLGSSPSAQPNVSNDQVSPRFGNENKEVSSTTRKPTKIAKQSRTSIPSFKVCFHNHFRELLANRKSRVGAPFCRCFAKLLLQHTCNNQIECRERCCARQIAYKASRWARSKTLCKSRLTMHTGTPHSKQMICLTQGLPSRNVFQVGSHVEIPVVFGRRLTRRPHEGCYFWGGAC